MNGATSSPAPAPTCGAAALADVADLVRRICVSRLGSDDGPDAAQEVMLRVCRAMERPEFRPAGLYGYAAAVARYEVMRSYGARDRHRHVALGEAAGHVAADPSAGPAELVERRLDAAAEVGRLVSGLSPRLRQVVAVALATDWDTDRAAAALRLSPSGVRSAQARAMAELRAAVGAASPNPLASGMRESQRRCRCAAARRRSPRPAGGQEVLDVCAA